MKQKKRKEKGNPFNANSSKLLLLYMAIFQSAIAVGIPKLVCQIKLFIVSILTIKIHASVSIYIYITF